ncbi:hypothetical protein EMIHUDRAFT_50939, partial [Emiliania huxleyi CCMP1516]|uniref:ATP-dependent transporter ycf16 n=2 Tax=Emiliania huxleyi TaxID=2903 RepID=A0A0D3JLU2_EMIH1
LSNDAQKLLDALPLIHLLWACPLMILVAALLLVDLAGVAALAGIGLLLTMIPLNLLLVRRLKAARAAHLPHSDARVARCLELVKGVRALKFHGWDAAFEADLLARRERELPYIRTELGLFARLMTMTIALPQLATALALAAAVLTSPSSPLTADLAFPVLSLFSVVRFPIMFFGELVGQLTQGAVALRRIGRFLARAEAAAANPRLRVSRSRSGRLSAPPPRRAVPPAAKAPAAPLAIDRLSLRVERGELLLVAGAVGCGKSTFLAGVLGEAVLEAGGVRTSPGEAVAYCAQTAWVQHMSVRDNILFGSSFDEARYTAVVNACALRADLAALPHGDATVVGERGVTLSGGQQQRVALARAVYSRPSLLLLDDVFSALDGSTGRHIFEALFEGASPLLGSAAVLLVGHATQFAPKAASCLVLHAGRPPNEAGDAAEPAEEEAVELEAAEAAGAEKSVVPGSATGDFAPEGSDEVRLGVRTMLAWARAAGGWRWFLPELLFFVCERFTYVGADFWLSAWTEAAPEAAGESSTADQRARLAVYSGFIFGNASFAFLRTWWFVSGGAVAARSIFRRLLGAVARSPMSFFDTTPVGRIAAPGPKGLTVIASSFWLFSGLTVVLAIVPVVAVAVVVCAAVFAAVHMLYLRSGVQMQRLYARAQAPLVSLIEESVAGGATIRAFGETHRFSSRLALLNDDASTAFLAFVGVGRWLAVRLETIGALISVSVCVALSALSEQLSGPIAGLAVIWSFNLTITLNFLVLSTSELEAKGVSLERVLGYTALPPEAPREQPEADAQAEREGWPVRGELRFEAVTLRYRPSLPPALDGFSCTIAAAERVGICGRTGAGKSSVAAALFRLVEVEAGRISLDGVDLRTLGLQRVRGRALGIVTQEPVLFRGAVRRSLDPLDQFTDEALWGALRAVGMEPAVRGLADGLSSESEEGGVNWSLGERQLLCFARAVLRAPRVLLLDEATASIDHAADARIQSALRTTMRETTLLTVAHRLHTVVDYDRILVLSAGRCVEAGAPHDLLRQEGSALSEMV